MGTRKNARLTFSRRVEMVRSVVDDGTSVVAAALKYGVSIPTIRKWVARFRAHGPAGLNDRSSRPNLTPKSTPGSITLFILELRRRGLPMHRIAAEVGCSISTVSRICARAGLSRLEALKAARVIDGDTHAHACGTIRIRDREPG